MKERNAIEKRSLRIDNTRVTSCIPYDHPVFSGVMKAREIIGGRFPDHVGQIVILPGIKRSSKKFMVRGECEETNQGGSKIRIYAESIIKTRTYSIEQEAARVTLHEFSHSSRSYEKQIGAWLDKQPETKWEEDDAERFVIQAFVNQRA